MKEKKTRIESSKKIVIYCDSLTALTVLCTITGFFLGLDITPMVELCRILAGLTGVAHSFYFWKAKCENLHKHHQDDKIEMGGDIGC